ncbi:DUF6603 domain-containing protein [Nonomuraea jabiensis]|uniref:DUF6603 domain-containing protein n=1 Tax=Nonomuraea jabiensis TaxID=882448 RepID=UPI0034212812
MPPVGRIRVRHLVRRPHDGDFVITAGGYHPHFAVPAHYPVVPRLGFTWQVSQNPALWGSAYYALTPSALMAGGSLTATWEDDSLRTWFSASMDFLIAWQPYHYEASFHVAVGASSYTFTSFGTHTITVHVGADVHRPGPRRSRGRWPPSRSSRAPPPRRATASPCRSAAPPPRSGFPRSARAAGSPRPTRSRSPAAAYAPKPASPSPR